jgi:oxygen-independent coproporphyrinogen-3 oxidase
MCQFSLDTKAFGQKHHIQFFDYFKPEVEELKELEAAGLMQWNGDQIDIPEKGRLLVRRVAMVFDAHLRQSQSLAKYSKVV